MKDRAVEFPNRYRLAKVEGTSDVYDLVPAPGTVTEEGTYINKKTLLTDETAAILGLNGDPTPNDAFMAIGSRPAVFNAYATDLYLFVTGEHPIVKMSPYNNYAHLRNKAMYSNMGMADELARNIELTGDKQTITVYDGGGTL